MKTKILFLSLVGVLGLSGCEFSNEPTVTELNFEDILSATDSFAEQDYKTLSYELMYSFDIESNELDEDVSELTSGSATFYTNVVCDASTSGDYYFYSKSSTVISDGTTDYLSSSTELEVLSIDNVYKSVYVTTYSASSDYSGDFEADLKSDLDEIAAYYVISKDTIIEVNSILSNPGYYKSGNDFTIAGDTIVENVAILSALLSSMEYDSEGVGSQKLDDDYKNTPVDYEFSFNQYGYLLKEEMKVLDSVSYTATVVINTETISYDAEIVNLFYSTNLSYDEKIERVGLYETYIVNTD